MKLATLDQLQEARINKQPVALLTYLDSGLQKIVLGSSQRKPSDPETALWDAAHSVLRSPRITRDCAEIAQLEGRDVRDAVHVVFEDPEFLLAAGGREDAGNAFKSV